VASDTAAARDRVVAARADLAEQLELLEASGRAAVDIPAKIRRSPAKAAAVVGGVGFLALKGPQRIFGLARRGVRGPAAALPTRMLPDEIEKTLRALGDDGDKVRGTLERDFAQYAKQAQKDRTQLRNLVLISAVRPLLTRGSRAIAEFVFSSDGESFSERLAEVRARAQAQADRVRDAGSSAPDGEAEPTEPPTGI
jgi:hypothetical protein